MRTFFFENALDFLYLVIELIHVKKIEYRARTACFVVLAAYYHQGNSRLDNSARAHLTGFKRYIQYTVLEPPVASFFAGFIYCRKLGMGQRILVFFTLVVAARNNLAILHNNASDGNFAYRCGLFCLKHGLLHELFVVVIKSH